MPKIFAFMVSAIAIVLTIACSIEPNEARTGFGLPGEVHQGAVEDWAFSEDAKLVYIETATRYWIPHSVTVWCVTVDDELYVSADYPEKKSWVANVARNPNIRLKIGDKVYEQKLVAVEDAATIASIDRGFVRKYDYDEEDYAEDITVGYWRVVERD